MSRTFRLIQKSYIIGTESEDGPGSLTNCTQRRGKTDVIWGGTSDEQPDAQFFYDYSIEMPEDEGEAQGFEPGSGNVGDAEYSYVLEELVDGKWRYRDTLHAVRDSADPPGGA